MIEEALKLCKGPACRSLRAHMSDLLDKELDAGREAMAKKHLRQCPACAREYREFEALVETCRKLPGLKLSQACRKKLKMVFKTWASTAMASK
jgi:anti-sigma factor RsiW